MSEKIIENQIKNYLRTLGPIKYLDVKCYETIEGGIRIEVNAYIKED